MAATSWRAIPAVLLACLGAAGGLARADGRGAASVFVYTDDDRLTVVHPAASVRAPLLQDVHASARYDADVISAATVDVRSAASVRPFTETRHGLGLGADVELARALRADAGYEGSFSPDYETHGGSVGFALDDDARVHTASLRLRGARDSVARVGDPEPVGSIRSFGGTAGVTSVLSAHAVGMLEAAIDRQRGYLENPYRNVPIADAAGLPPFPVPESVPDTRVRAALAGSLRLALPSDLFLRALYRLHADDWGVAGHTLRASLSQAAWSPWIVTAFGRVYQQRAATFYRGRYVTAPNIPSLRTLDRELAATYAFGGGARVERSLLSVWEAELRLDVQVELLHQRYLRTPRLPERTSLIAGMTVSAEY